jgi:hypothetical protein
MTEPCLLAYLRLCVFVGVGACDTEFLVLNVMMGNWTGLAIPATCASEAGHVCAGCVCLAGAQQAHGHGHCGHCKCRGQLPRGRHNSPSRRRGFAGMPPVLLESLQIMTFV